MKKKIFYLFILLTINNYSQNKGLNIGYTKSKNYFEEFHFDFIKNKIIVPVEIEGVTYKFILDTGAPNIISEELNKVINPKPLQIIPVTDANGKRNKLSVVSVKTLKFGNIIFKNTATLVYNLNTNPILKCFGIDGFIGSNMLRHSIIQIDAEQQKIILTDNRKKLNLNKKNSVKIKLIDPQSSPYLWIALKGTNHAKEHVLIDTGMDGIYDIALKNYTLLKKEKIFTPIGESKGASGISLFGDVPLKKHLKLHLPTLKINGLEIKNSITHTTNDDNSRIGAKILKYGIITIDFKNKRFYLNPKHKTINIKAPPLNFSKTIKNGKLIIGFVWDTKLKEKISYGDEILEINGKKIVLCDLITNAFFYDKSGPITLKIKPKKGAVFELIINKKTQD